MACVSACGVRCGDNKGIMVRYVYGISMVGFDVTGKIKRSVGAIFDEADDSDAFINNGRIGIILNAQNLGLST